MDAREVERHACVAQGPRVVPRISEWIGRSLKIIRLGISVICRHEVSRRLPGGGLARRVVGRVDRAPAGWPGGAVLVIPLAGGSALLLCLAGGRQNRAGERRGSADKSSDHDCSSSCPNRPPTR